MRVRSHQHLATRLRETSSRYSFEPRWSPSGVKVVARIACARSTASSVHGCCSTAASASVARIGLAATPPNAKRARRTRPPASRSIAIAAATVLMSSSRRLDDLVKAKGRRQRLRDLDRDDQFAWTQRRAAVAEEERRQRAGAPSLRSGDDERSRRARAAAAPRRRSATRWPGCRPAWRGSGSTATQTARATRARPAARRSTGCRSRRAATPRRSRSRGRCSETAAAPESLRG